MRWRWVLRYAALSMVLVSLITGGAWLVLLGYGEDAMANNFLVIAGVAFFLGGMFLALSRVQTTRSFDDWAHPRSSTRVTYPNGTTRTYAGHPYDVQMEGPPMASTRELPSWVSEMTPLSVRDLPPPRGTVISDEIRYYPSLDRTDMLVEEYDRWTSEFGPVEGEWEEREARRRREMYMDNRR